MRNGFWDSRTDFDRAVRRHDALDADIQGFFDNIGHQWLLQLLEHEITGRRILGVIRKWLKAGVSEPKQGTPQGSGDIAR